MSATFVYVISGHHGRQKIGVSDDPRRRILELQTGSPFPLQFEFIGVTAGTGYDIEGEAHFLLHQHKAPGGDEWFVVPPEVAITAVMAAARRLGHDIKPIDADQIPRYLGFGLALPPWRRWLRAPLTILAAAIMVPAFFTFAGGHVGIFYLIFMAGLATMAVKLCNFVLVEGISATIAIWRTCASKIGRFS